MARFQILELPTVYRPNGIDETPFVLVIDQADDAFRHSIAPTQETMRMAQAALAEAIGARSVLVFPGTVELPANEVTVVESPTAPLIRKAREELSALTHPEDTFQRG